MKKSFRNPLRHFKRILLFLFFCLAMLAGYFVYDALHTPSDAPIARMYRSEADLRSLVTALDAYLDAHGSLPPAGQDGLKMATDLLSEKGHYMPGGPPADGWGRAFTYIPSEQYSESDSAALKIDGKFFAPDSYQVYSRGEDGDHGIAGSDGAKDNINNWDTEKKWRDHYRSLNERFMSDRRERNED